MGGQIGVSGHGVPSAVGGAAGSPGQGHVTTHRLRMAAQIAREIRQTAETAWTRFVQVSLLFHFFPNVRFTLDLYAKHDG